MRPGVIVSTVGHAGVVMIMTLSLSFWAKPVLIEQSGAAVPVEITSIAPESNVRALSAPQEDEAATAEQQSQAQPISAPSPAPPPPPQQRTHDNFDVNAIAGMLDKQRHGAQRRTNGAASTRNQAGVGPGTADVASLQDRVRALLQREMARCWRMPADLPNPERLVVTVQLDLDRNGHLRGQPVVVSPRNTTFDAPMHAAVEAALRAVRQCDPYPFPDDPIVGSHFDLWSEQEYTFRVSE